MSIYILCLPIAKWRRKLEKRRSRKRWEKARADLMWMASNGMYFPKSVRENFDMPDWTGH